MKNFKTIKIQLFASFLLLIGSIQPGFSSIVDMAENQNWQGVQASISTEDVNERQPDGMSALFWAVYYDQTDMVRLLLNANANADANNRFGVTPLIQASMNGNGAVISMLLDSSANPNTYTLQGDTALMNAAKAGSTTGVQALIEAGAEIDARDSHLSQTSLMWAAANNNAEIVRILGENGADINARSAELEFAGITQGGPSGFLPSGGLTALHHAARENAIQSVEVLLSLGANPNILDPQGISPLRIAAANANLDLAKILIEGGSNINDGALVDIMELEYKELAFARAATNYTNQTTVRNLLTLMFDMGVDLDAYPETALPYPHNSFTLGKGTSGRTALYNSTEGLHNDLMTLLLEEGANPNSLSNGNTPLSAALFIMSGTRPSGVFTGVAERKLTDLMPTIQLLLNYGADVNTLTGTGGSADGTLLHQAAFYGNDEVIEFLLDKGVDLSQKDSSNRTALDIASGVPAVGDEMPTMGGMPATETPIYENTMVILTEAMNAQGIAIEEYVAPPLEEGDEESGEA